MSSETHSLPFKILHPKTEKVLRSKWNELHPWVSTTEKYCYWTCNSQATALPSLSEPPIVSPSLCSRTLHSPALPKGPHGVNMPKATGCFLVFQPSVKLPLGSLIKSQILHIQNWTTVVFPHSLLYQTFLSSFQLMPIPLFCLLRPETWSYPWCLSFSVQSVRKFSWMYFQNIYRLQLFLITTVTTALNWATVNLTWVIETASEDVFSPFSLCCLQSVFNRDFKTLNELILLCCSKPRDGFLFHSKAEVFIMASIPYRSGPPFCLWPSLYSFHFRHINLCTFLHDSRSVPASEACFSCTLCWECSSQNICVAT